MSSQLSSTQQNLTCYHCGDKCQDHSHQVDDKVFCCSGCQTVYQILEENKLEAFYTIDKKAGIRTEAIDKGKFAYLDIPEIKSRLIDFTDGNITKVSFFIPTIHCSSCIWLLENLYRINAAITFSRTDFLKKRISITFLEQETSLRTIVELLTSLGYEPQISLDNVENPERNNNAGIPKTFTSHKLLVAKLAVAGFAFGNIMLISFPEYFGFDTHSEHSFRYLFNFLNILLALPVFFFSGWGYLKSAYQNLRRGILNVDTPLALGMIVVFTRSLVDIFMGYGPGYLDTLSGFVFFSLIGKWFQQRTYDTLRYDRDFKSYFPVAVTVKDGETEKQVPVSELQVGNRIIIRNQELVPADSLLISPKAHIDYSFVTGESMPMPKQAGETLYAGGRQVGNAIEMEVVKPVSQSYLTQLWNDEAFASCRTCVSDPATTPVTSSSESIQNLFNRYFTVALLLIATVSSGFWIVQHDYSRALNAFTSVLIVACPCALVLGSSFALGNAIRILGKYSFFAKNTQAIENIARLDAIVFDKTGTITESNTSDVEFVGYEHPLTDTQKKYILALVKNSVHPLSQHLYKHLSQFITSDYTTEQFQEISGKGLSGLVNGHQVWIGSAEFMYEKLGAESVAFHFPDTLTTRVLAGIEGEYLGYFQFHNHYRKGLDAMNLELSMNYDLHLLSGDNAGEAPNLKYFFKDEQHLHFHQSPADKLNFIKALQSENKQVMMLGDGLNDAGALQQSNVGVAVSDNIAYFTPASDVILDASNLWFLPGFIYFCKQSVKVIKAALVLAAIYNLVGIFFAVQGTLSPLIAAILMPVSSINVILFTTFSVRYFGKRLEKNRHQLKTYTFSAI
ncbi:heavy metal translocating P-type ATPase [Xanthocytophaga flava]|uniref:heavy metal translocating P-type ATPase n=1 Tax=Xanthocytophaga flava TaxID=3048013 RepID=UPI0028D5CDD7|nr:heavy metal translocating P-type ATPase metal-binding domain-containing protein [Xanthocytophaga flavus]MDJ1466681.1 heavy metal translocating P-type ATPase metal-binding domain-containing protein [Xanthocytophaga flavus]